MEEDLPMGAQEDQENQENQEARMLYSLYLPVTDNAGRPFPEELEWVWATLTRTVGSYTALPPGTGCWINATGVQACEPIVVLQVVCPASRETEAFFAQLARELAVRLRQEEIFLLSQPICQPRALGGAGGRAPRPARAVAAA